MEIRCKTCKFHEPLPSGGRDGSGKEVPVGSCFRYPPQVGPAGSSFPVVGSDTNWCGEYVPTLKQKAAEARNRSRPKRGK